MARFLAVILVSFIMLARPDPVVGSDVGKTSRESRIVGSGHLFGRFDEPIFETKLSIVDFRENVLIPDLAYRNVTMCLVHTSLGVQLLTDIFQIQLKRHRFTGTNSGGTSVGVLPIVMHISSDISIFADGVKTPKENENASRCLSLIRDHGSCCWYSIIRVPYVSHMLDFYGNVSPELLRTHVGCVFECAPNEVNTYATYNYTSSGGDEHPERPTSHGLLGIKVAFLIFSFLVSIFSVFHAYKMGFVGDNAYAACRYVYGTTLIICALIAGFVIPIVALATGVWFAAYGNFFGWLS